MTTKETLIQNLNEDLAAEYGKIIRYTYQFGKAFGLKSVELRELFVDDISDGLKHASFLNDVIVDLGGEPVTEPTRFDKPDVLRIMLAVDGVLEFRNEENYMAHAEAGGIFLLPPTQLGRTSY